MPVYQAKFYNISYTRLGVRHSKVQIPIYLHLLTKEGRPNY